MLVVPFLQKVVQMATFGLFAEMAALPFPHQGHSSVLLSAARTLSPPTRLQHRALYSTPLSEAY